MVKMKNYEINALTNNWTYFYGFKFFIDEQREVLEGLGFEHRVNNNDNDDSYVKTYNVFMSDSFDMVILVHGNFLRFRIRGKLYFPEDLYCEHTNYYKELVRLTSDDISELVTAKILI